MIEFACYILELVKFMIIYLLGFSMKLTKVLWRRVAACAFIVSMGVWIYFGKPGLVHPIVYVLSALFVGNILIEWVSCRNIIAAFWSVLIVFSVDSISYALMKIISKTTGCQLNLYQNLLAGFIALIILGVIFGVISHNQRMSLQDLSIWYLIAFSIICIVNVAALTLAEKKFMNLQGEYTAMYVMLVISSFVQMAFVLMLVSSNNWYRKNEKLAEHYLELQIEHYQYLEERNQTIKKFRHDMRAHMYILKQYIFERKWGELNNYIDTICGKIEYKPGGLSVKNETADAILNYYNKQFAKRNSTLEVVGSLPQECHIDAYDLCTIFSNILSNAVESIGTSKEGQAALSVHFDDDIIFIREENTYTGKLEKQGGKIVTTKTDNELHGFGIQNIKDSVARYKGTVTVTESGQSFVMDIVMENIEPAGKFRKNPDGN